MYGIWGGKLNRFHRALLGHIDASLMGYYKSRLMNLFVRFARVMTISLGQMRVPCSRHVAILVLCLSFTCVRTHTHTRAHTHPHSCQVPKVPSLSALSLRVFLSNSHSFPFCISRSHSLSRAHPPSNPLTDHIVSFSS